MFILPPPSRAAQQEETDRLRWVQEYLRVGMLVRQDEACVWVGRRYDFKDADGEVNWFEIGNGKPTPLHHLRTVLLNQIVFDVGDDTADHTPTPWATTVRYTMAICEACTRLGIPLLVGLSGGKGIHLEIFLSTKAPTIVRRGLRHDPKDDWRWPIALRILALANHILFGDTFWAEETIIVDQLLIAPAEGSRLVREFSEQKSPSSKMRKLLWHEGLGPVAPIPTDKAQAYAAAEAKAAQRGSPRPVGPIPIASEAKRLDTRWAASLLGRPCPTSASCLEVTCAACPIREVTDLVPSPIGGRAVPALDRDIGEHP